ncbi:PadR family transcriptional regulator [Dictyobacter kobayashii]|nr:PadR family transcriptional regulator [Dictyobacter kobayashii]
MYKPLMLLGLLAERPMYGQQIREVIELHHDAFSQFIKKPTMYYHLDRLVSEGLLEVRSEVVEAPGPGLAYQDVALREREVYYLTDAGRQRFAFLLREALQSYEPGPSVIDAAIFFLDQLAPQEAVSLLQARRERLIRERAQVTEQIAAMGEQDRAHLIVNDHTCTSLDAEIGWLERTIARLSLPRTVRPEL